jgi:uncharacterized membrane protein YbhN (UPF0104 family)
VTLNKRLLLFAKLAILLAVAALIAWQLHKTWGQLAETHIQVDWRYGILGVICFAGVFVSSGIVWRWLAWRMGDRSPTIPLLGAYVFSQIGKYVPGKVMLLLMRIERARRCGMDGTTCTVSTLVENAMYMVSGGLVAALSLLLYVGGHPAYAAGVAIMIAGMLVAFYPPVFYGLVNVMLRKAQRPPVTPAQQLALRTLLAAVVMFIPCWLCGGLALWSAARCITPLPLDRALSFPGAFAFSVIGGMAMALTPGGLGTREAMLTLFLGPVVTPPIAGIVAVLQRLFQIIAEAGLGGLGALLTARRLPHTPPDANGAPRAMADQP